MKQYFIFAYHKGKLAGIAEVSESAALYHVAGNLSGHQKASWKERRKQFYRDMKKVAA